MSTPQKTAPPPHALDVEINGPEGPKLLSRVVGPAVTVGRTDGNTIVLKHSDVSRTHARFEYTAQGIVVHDLSTNGTFVDGRRIVGQQALPLGRQVKVGPFLIRFRPVGAGPQKVVSGEAVARGKTPSPDEILTPGPSVVAEGAFEVDEELLVDRVEHEEEPEPGPVRPAPPAAKQQAHAAAKQISAAAHQKAAAIRTASTALIPIPQPTRPSRSEPSPSLPPSDIPDSERDRLKRWLRGLLLEALDLPSLRPEELEDKKLGPRVLQLMDELLDEHARELPRGLDRPRLRKELADEVLGLGPLEDMLGDDQISEVMVVDRQTIYVEKKGRLELTPARFSSEDALRSAIERIVTPLGRRIDESNPMVDARLKDGSRVNAIIPPLALRGPCLTIRKFSKRKLGLEDLIQFGSVDERMARFLLRAVVARRNILVSGGTGSGKTTLLNVLSSAIPEDERIVTIEDAAELRLGQPHVVSLETRPANMEGKGEFTIRDLVRNALRMRPDRIIVGECRGGEALDMLQAMNTGHDGSLTTTHANSPVEAVARLETLVLMAGVDLPTRAIREQIANSIHLVVQQARFVDGTRKVTKVSEVVGLDDEGQVELEDIFEFHRLPGERGRVEGEFRATGYMPSFLHEFITMGLITDGEFL